MLNIVSRGGIVAVVVVRPKQMLVMMYLLLCYACRHQMSFSRRCHFALVVLTSNVFNVLPAVAAEMSH